MPTRTSASLRAELVAVVVTVAGGAPYVLASGDPTRLPAGPLTSEQPSLQDGVREFAAEQTGHRLGFVEQLYTFADSGRTDEGRVVSLSYLGLTRVESPDHRWSGIYDLLPWEDRRSTASDELLAALTEGALTWARHVRGATRAARLARVEHLLAVGQQPWRPELALQRYELAWEAGLVAESPDATTDLATGSRMQHDHRRIVATALSRVRSSIQYRPVVFELVPEEFTLLQLQQVVEALAGQHLHKQNFRRLVEVQAQLVEPTSGTAHGTGGRPARLYRFRRDVLAERHQVGTKLPLPRPR